MYPLLKIVMLLAALTAIFLLPLLLTHWLCIYALGQRNVSDHHRRTILWADVVAALAFFGSAFLLILFFAYYPYTIYRIEPIATITKPALWVITKIAGPQFPQEEAISKIAVMVVFILIYMLSWLLAILNTMFLMQSPKKHEKSRVTLAQAITINLVALLCSFIIVPLVFFIIASVMR